MRSNGTAGFFLNQTVYRFFKLCNGYSMERNVELILSTNVHYVLMSVLTEWQKLKSYVMKEKAQYYQRYNLHLLKNGLNNRDN